MKFLKAILLSSFCILNGSYTEDTILDLVSQYISADPIIIEAGAWNGADTLKISKQWPLGHIYSFEPLIDSYQTVKAVTEYCNNVQLFNMALHSYSGVASFYVSEANSGASSLLAPNLSLVSHLQFTTSPIQVACVNLDEWMVNNNIDHVDFMWLDMEGAELQMLKASPQAMAKVTAVYIELNCKEFRYGTPLYHEVKHWFQAQGFVQKWVDINLEWQGNGLFVRLP